MRRPEAVTCNGTLTLDLPPGIAVAGGRRTLSADILYTVQPAADASGNVVTLSNAEEIITPLCDAGQDCARRLNRCDDQPGPGG